MKTPIQKQKFEKEFNKLLKRAPLKIRKMWLGKIVWTDYKNIPSRPSVDYIVNFFPKDLKDEYQQLLNKLKSGTI